MSNYQTMINSVVRKNLASEKMPPAIEVNLTSDGNRYGLAFLGRSPRDVRMRHVISMWLSTHNSNTAVKRTVLMQGARGKVHYAAKPGCMYWTPTQLDALIAEATKVLDKLGPQIAELDAKVQVDIDRYNALMPGEVETLGEIQATEHNTKVLSDATERLDHAQSLLDILAKVERHGDTQVVVPYWVQPVPNIYILHKCVEEFPREARDYLFDIVKVKGPIWSQFFWKSFDRFPCPNHVSSYDSCKETLPVYVDGIPQPIPRHIAVLVKESMTTTNLRDWDLFRRGMYAWWQATLSHNFVKGRKTADQVMVPPELGGRNLTKTNRVSGDQRLQKQINLALAQAMKPVQDALVLLQQKAGSTETGRSVVAKDGSQILIVDTTEVAKGIDALAEEVKSTLDNPPEVETGSSDVSPDELTGGTSEYTRSDMLREPEIGMHSYRGALWAIATSSHELTYVMSRNAADSVAELVLWVGSDHEAFPPNYDDFESVWLVSTDRVLIPAHIDLPKREIQNEYSRTETVWELPVSLRQVKSPTKEDKGKGKKQEEGPASQAVKPAEKSVKPKAKQTTAGSNSQGAEASSSSSPKKEKPAVQQENPLKVKNVPKSADLTDEQKSALKIALELPTDIISQDDLAAMTQEERRKALSARSLPRWAVTAVLNNPANLERIVKKELTKDNFGKKAADRGSSAQVEWTILRQKFPKVNLLERPVSNKEKDLKKAWDALVRKWGRDVPGLPTPKAKGGASEDRSSGGRGRSRSRARASPPDSMAGFIEVAKVIGELARAFGGK